MNPRPPRCERGALPAELLPHLRAGKHSRRFAPVLSIRARPCSSQRPPSCRFSAGGLPARGNPPSVVPSVCPTAGVPQGAHFIREWGALRFSGGAGNRAKTIKFFAVLPINVLRKYPRPGGTTLLTRWRREKYLPWRKRIGGNNVTMRSPLRMGSPPHPHPELSRALAQETAPGKGSRRAALTRTAISSSRNERFSGIANHPHVIRGRGVNIKIVHGNRYFPVDTANAIF